MFFGQKYEEYGSVVWLLSKKVKLGGGVVARDKSTLFLNLLPANTSLLVSILS